MTAPQRSSNLTLYLSLFFAFLCFVGNSPKWTIPLAPWLGVAFLLHFVRSVRWWKGLLLGVLASFAGAAIANYEVIPFPLPVMLAILIVSSILGMLPYLADKWLARSYPSFFSTLLFPAVFTLLDFWAASHSQAGTWGMIGYTQYKVAPLFQLASLTGIWGIGFLIYWFGSAANYIAERIRQEQPYRRAAGVYLSFLALAFLYGSVRLQLAKHSDAPAVKVAAVTVENLSLMEQMYFAETGEEIHVPKTISQSDPLLQKVSRVMASFVKEPGAARFAVVYDQSHLLMDELLTLSRQAAGEGARMIGWSEGVLMAGKDREGEYVARAQQFARENGVYLYFPMAAVFRSDPLSGEPFMENKIFLIDPEGEILNTYLKNRPVPGEPSVPGDGILPAIETPYGRLSQAICYDADFPDLMDLLQEQKIRLFYLPSGDWRAISPYHSYMAVARSIENGAALVRPVSGGLSIATDPYGRVLARDDFFEDDQHYLLAEIPLATVTTLYGRWGNWMVYLRGLLLLPGILFSRLRR